MPAANTGQCVISKATVAIFYKTKKKRKREALQSLHLWQMVHAAAAGVQWEDWSKHKFTKGRISSLLTIRQFKSRSDSQSRIVWFLWFLRPLCLFALIWEAAVISTSWEVVEWTCLCTLRQTRIRYIFCWFRSQRWSHPKTRGPSQTKPLFGGCMVILEPPSSFHLINCRLWHFCIAQRWTPEMIHV